MNNGEKPATPVAASLLASNDSMMKWALRELISSLPQSRDWLNPDAEKILREALVATPALPVVKEIEAAIELPEKPWGEDMGAWLEARDDSEIDDEITTYATAAVLKDRATLIAWLDAILKKAELGRGSCGMNYDGGKLATGVKEVCAALKGQTK